MGKWGNLSKFLVPLGTGILASHGIPLPLDQIIHRPKRSRRRRRGSIDYVALATGIRETLKAQLSDDELEEVDMVLVEIFRLGEQEDRGAPRRSGRGATPTAKAAEAEDSQEKVKK